MLCLQFPTQKSNFSPFSNCLALLRFPTAAVPTNLYRVFLPHTFFSSPVSMELPEQALQGFPSVPAVPEPAPLRTMCPVLCSYQGVSVKDSTEGGLFLLLLFSQPAFRSGGALLGRIPGASGLCPLAACICPWLRGVERIMIALDCFV